MPRLGRGIHGLLIDLKAEAGGRTKLTFTEQGVYFDGYDDAKAREEGMAWLLGKLGESL